MANSTQTTASTATTSTRSFLDLCQGPQQTQIVIPLIQRDYAQGRTTGAAERIRRDFVSEIHSHIISGQRLSLDFVYGELSNGRFVPLDGQQRLTTLLLVHLYIESVTGNAGKTEYRFTYETRESSKRFVESLIKNAGQTLAQAKAETTISEMIKDEPWWFRAWGDDPTVAGMLTMLDEIHRVFYADREAAYQSLFGSGKPCITFEHMPITGFHDADDLYIKMNARGLPLTDFEKFKNRLVGDIEQHLAPAQATAAKTALDGMWTDTLWPLRAKGMRNIDTYLERLLRVLIASETAAMPTATAGKGGKAVTDTDTLFDANNRRAVFAYSAYKALGVPFGDADFLRRIISDLHTLLDKGTTHLASQHVAAIGEPWMDVAETVRAVVFKSETIGYKERLLLHAYLHIAQSGVANAEQTEWLRLMHHLEAAAGIDNSQRMLSALRSADAMLAAFLASGHSTVREWLADAATAAPAFFPAWQWAEEAFKAQLCADAAWCRQISLAEQHAYLDGQIGVTLYVAGLCGTTLPYPTLTAPPTAAAATAYGRCLDRLLPLLSEAGKADTEVVRDSLLVRAMLAKGDYPPLYSSGRRNLHNRPGDRDYSWKRLFRIGGLTAWAPEASHTTALECLRDIVGDAAYDPAHVARSLSAIALYGCRGTRDWREALLGPCGTAVLSGCRQGFVAFEKGDCFVYAKQRRSGEHRELQSLALFHELLSNGNAVTYTPVSSAQENSRIDINGAQVWHRDGRWTLSATDGEQTFDCLAALLPCLRMLGVSI